MEQPLKLKRNREDQLVLTYHDIAEILLITTGLCFREKFYYGLLAAGLALVLFLSLLCNFYFCINRKCNKESGLILKESLTSPLQILEENVPNDNQRISLVEMHEIPVYETINENQMLSNLAIAVQSNGRTVRQLKQSQSTSQLMKNNNHFLYCIYD
jgi:hypothetical protein